MNYQYVKIEVEQGVGYLTLDNGGRFNILHSACITELKTAFTALIDDPEAVVIVLSGGQGESFAVGANIAEMRDFEPQDGLRFSEHGQSLFALMEAADKPIIGALNGITMGGGVDLALACDIRLASDVLRIAHPGARLGIITGFGGTQKLPRLIGRNFALEMFMTSDSYTAQDALRMHLVDKVFAQDTFLDEVRAYARHMAAMTPAALSYAKKLINSAEDIDLRNGEVMELGAFSTLFSTDFHKEKAARFLAKRASG